MQQRNGRGSSLFIWISQNRRGSTTFGDRGATGTTSFWSRPAATVAARARIRSRSFQPVAAAGATVYDDFPTGGIVLDGSVAATVDFGGAPAAGIVLGGSVTVTKSYADAPASGIVLGGSSSVSKSYTNAPAGGIVLGGSVAVAETEDQAPAGGIVLGGTSWGDQVLLDDDFGRVVVDAWGGQWTKIAAPTSDGPATDLSVDGTRGTVQSPTHKRDWIQARDVWLRDLSITGVVDLSLIPTGSSIAVAALLRWTDASNYYRPRIIFTASAVVQTAVAKFVAGAGSNVVTTATALTGYTATTLVRFRFSIVGTRIRVTTWYDGNAEPAPQVDVTDASLTLDGGLILEADLTGLTNNPAVHIDEIRARTIAASIDYVSPAVGGIVLGGSVASAKVYADAPAGGIVLGGTAPSSISGGGTTYTDTPVGGIVLGGSTTVAVTKASSPAGGLVLGGAATFATGYSQTPIGGIVVGGSSTSSLATSFTPAGGIVLGGTAPSSTGLVWTSSPAGGIVLGGLATSTRDLGGSPAGGVVLGGSTTSTLSKASSPIGGITLGGSSTSSLATSFSIAGGIILGGIATIDDGEILLTATDRRTRYLLRVTDRTVVEARATDRRTRYVLTVSDRRFP